MIYELIGRLTVKVVRYWLSRKAPPSGALMAVAAAVGLIAAATAVLVASGSEPSEDG